MGFMLLIAIILSLGAVNALIPLLIVLVIIVAAAGSTRGYSIFNFFGLATLAGINPGGKASMVGKSGLSQLMAMVSGFSSGKALNIGKKINNRYKSWRKMRYTRKKLFKMNPVGVPQGSKTVPQGSLTARMPARGSGPVPLGFATPFELGPRMKTKFSLWPVYKSEGKVYGKQKGKVFEFKTLELYKKHTPGSFLRSVLKMPQKGTRFPLLKQLRGNDSLAEKVNRVMGLRVLKYALVAAVPLSLPLYNVVHKRIGMSAEVNKLARKSSVQPLLQRGQELRAQVESGEKTKRAAFKAKRAAFKEFKEEYEKTADVPKHSPTRFAAEVPISLASAALYALNKEKEARGAKGADEAKIRAEKWKHLKQNSSVKFATNLADVLDVHPMNPTPEGGRIIPGAFIGSENMTVRLELHRIKSNQYGESGGLESLQKRVNESSFKNEENRNRLDRAIEDEKQRRIKNEKEMQKQKEALQRDIPKAKDEKNR